jgi:hypothetical protein
MHKPRRYWVFGRASLLLFAAIVQQSTASLVLYEGFDYPTTASMTRGTAGDRSLSGIVLSPPATAISLTNGGGYLNPYLVNQQWFPINIDAGGAAYNVAADVSVVSGNLHYPLLQASRGNRVQAAGSGYSPRLNFPDVPSTGNTSASNSYNGSVFYSAIVRVDTMPGNADGDPLFSFAALDNLSTGGTSAFFAGMFVKPNNATTGDPNDFLIGVSKGQTVSGTAATYGTESYQLGSTLFVVGEWQFVANANPLVREANDIARLYINPTALGGSALGSNATVVTDLGISADDLPLGSRSIKGFVIHQRNASVSNFVVDEVRVGTTFADVTPAAAGFLGGGSSQLGIGTDTLERGATVPEPGMYLQLSIVLAAAIMRRPCRRRRRDSVDPAYHTVLQPFLRRVAQK